MTSCFEFFRAGLLGLALVLGLAGCANLQPAPPVEPLLQDGLFMHPPVPAEADAAMALDDAMRAYLAGPLLRSAGSKGNARALVDALYAGRELRLEYDTSSTRTAAQAFAARAGNCLSLVLMTASFARELGLVVSYQSALLEEAYSRNGDLTLRSGHVNLVLGPRPPPGGGRWTSLGPDADSLQIDFLPADELRGLRSVVIEERTVLAMFMNNRAAEALARHQTTEAYAWVREALRRDPGFRPAINTLGVVYQRAGQLAAAAAAYEHLLGLDPRQVATLWNLAQVRQAQGRFEDAAHWDARRRAIEPMSPFQQLQQGEAAMALGAYAQARELFEREQRLTGESSELHFWLALAAWRLGEPARAQRELQQAIRSSPDAVQQARYVGKLAWLKAQGQY